MTTAIIIPKIIVTKETEKNLTLTSPSYKPANIRSQIKGVIEG